MLILLIHELGISFHLFRSFISFTSVLYFAEYKFYMSDGKLSLSVIFDAAVRSFLNFVWGYSLQVFGALLILTLLNIKL